jgi:hypothetical protein
MAVMARSLGIPARVGVGYLPGTRMADGHWEIKGRDAHAWPELYFQNLGWIRFEPTPSTRTGEAPAWSVPLTAAVPTPTSSAASAAPAVPDTAANRALTDPAGTAAPEESLVSRVLGAVPWRVLGVLALMLLLLAVPLGSSHALRWVRRRRARTPVAQIEAAWDELRERLGDLGVGWASSWTPRALQRRLISDHVLAGSDRAALGRLVEDLERVRYAPPGSPGRPATEVFADVDLLVRAVTGSPMVGVRSRRRARWFPASGAKAMAGALRSADAAAGEAGRRASQLTSGLRRSVEGRR